jgi:hypothetical protein
MCNKASAERGVGRQNNTAQEWSGGGLREFKECLPVSHNGVKKVGALYSLGSCMELYRGWVVEGQLSEF